MSAPLCIYYRLYDLKKSVQLIVTYPVANSVKDGKNYGVPYDSNTVIACYRTDYLDQAGYTIDDLTDITWDRFIEIGKDVLDKTGMPMLTNVRKRLCAT